MTGCSILNSLVRLVLNGIPHAPLFWKTRNDSDRALRRPRTSRKPPTRCPSRPQRTKRSTIGRLSIHGVLMMYPPAREEPEYTRKFRPTHLAPQYGSS